MSLGYGDDEILSDINLSFSEQGLVAIMGPSGTGKSSLLRTIAGISRSNPDFWLDGDIHFLGKPIQTKKAADIQPAISFFSQKSRLYTGTLLENLIPGSSQLDSHATKERAKDMLTSLNLWDEFRNHLDTEVMSLSIGAHKKILFARMSAASPKCILVDEPYSSVSLVEEACINALLRKMSESCLVLMVTHNKLLAAKICHHVVLLSGGKLIETGLSKDFFLKPQTQTGRNFLESGSSWFVADDTSETSSKPRKHATAVIMPRGFYWIRNGLLGGMMKPGLLDNIERDYLALNQLKVKNIISLLEQPIDLERANDFNLHATHFPINDMHCPELQATDKMCAWISAQMEQGHACILHCKAGLGRTGLMLASILVYQGASAVQAIHEIRTINNSYIQSDEQFNFISLFEAHLRRS